MAIINYKMGNYYKSENILRTIEKKLPWNILILSIYATLYPDNEIILKKMDKIDYFKYSLLIRAKQSYLKNNKIKSINFTAEAIQKNPELSNTIFVMEKIYKDPPFIKKLIKKIDISSIKTEDKILNYYGDFLAIAGFYNEAKNIYSITNDKNMKDFISVVEHEKKDELTNFLIKKIVSTKNDEKKLLYKISLSLLKGSQKIDNCDLDIFIKLSEKIKNYTYLLIFTLLNKNIKMAKKFLKINFKLFSKKYFAPIYYPYIVRTMYNPRIMDNDLVPISFWRIDGNFTCFSERLPTMFFIINNRYGDIFSLKNYIKNWKLLLEPSENELFAM